MATSSKWTAEEDEILVKAILAAGSRICWNEIAELLPGRCNKSCRKRWMHSLDPSLRKGRWATPEDVLLVTAVQKYGRRWYKVAELVPGRTDDQCAKRWRDKLDPSIRHDAWTEGEDLQLLEAFAKHGKRWNVISGCIKGRPAIQCRNRFLSLQKAGKAPEDGESSTTTTVPQGLAQATKMTEKDALSGFVTPDIHGLPELTTSGTPAKSPLLPPSYPSLSSSPFSTGSSLPLSGYSSVAPSPTISIGSSHSNQIPTDTQVPQVNLDFASVQFYGDQDLGIDSNPNSFSSSFNTPSSSTFQETLNQNDPGFTATSHNFAEQRLVGCPFAWGENLAMASGDAFSSSQVNQDPSPLSFQEQSRGFNTHPPSIPYSEDNSFFLMGCPLPLCDHQFSELISLWRHITWDHLGMPPDVPMP